MTRRSGLVLAGVVSLVVVLGLLRATRDETERKLSTGSRMIMAWEGFGPEKGLYNFTMVTALIDIGRGNWSHQERSFNTYLIYMQHVLRLDVNIVVFVDPKGQHFVRWMRRGREQHTRVVPMELKALPYYKYRDRIREIMGSVEYRMDNELVRKGLCESHVPEYEIVVWSKLYFLHQAIAENPFASNYFIWLDAGYGRGEEIYPSDGIWWPRGLFEHVNRVTVIERSPGVESFREHAARLHKMSINIIAGGFTAGGPQALERLYALQQEVISDWMRENHVVDDEQTIYMLIYYKHSELFNLVRGDWYDVFKLFNRQINT